MRIKIEDVIKKQNYRHVSYAIPDTELCSMCFHEVETDMDRREAELAAPAPAPLVPATITAKDKFKAIQAALRILDTASIAVSREFPGSGTALSSYRPWNFIYHAKEYLAKQVNSLDEFDGTFEAPTQKP